MNVRTSARKRKTPAVHHVTLVSSVVAWRPPMIVSVPAPPPMDASPPPCPAWSNTAAARTSASSSRITMRNVYMRGARYLCRAGAHKLGPGMRIERRSPHQDAVNFGLGEQVSGVLETHTSTVQDGRDLGAAVGQPATDRHMDLGSVLGGRVFSRADCPNRLVRDGHTAAAGPAGERRFQLARHDVERLALFALLERFAHAQHG